MKAGTDFQEAGHAAAQSNATFGRFGNAAEDLQERGLASAVPADDPQYLALLHLEGDVPQSPKFLAGDGGRRGYG